MIKLPSANIREALGVLIVCVGLWIIWPPAAIMVVGLYLILSGLVTERRQ